MLRTTAFVLLCVLSCSAQIVLPEGAKIRVRLDQNITSATAEEGQTVEFSAADPVRVGDTVVISEGARSLASSRRRMRNAGWAGQASWTFRSIASGQSTTSGFHCAIRSPRNPDRVTPSEPAS